MPGAIISISSSEGEDSDFENDVPPVAAFAQASSSPALRARPAVVRPRAMSGLCETTTAVKRKSADDRPLVTELASSSDSDIHVEPGHITLARTRLAQSHSSPISQPTAGPSRRSRSPPVKRAKSAPKVLDVINAFAKDPSTWTVDEPSTNAVASTSASATRAAPARRIASAPSTRPRHAYSDIISELDDIKDFTEEIQSDDVDMDVWEERQRLKQNGKGKERELINGAPKPPTASQKAKSPAKRKGKTDEEKAADLAEKAKKKADADIVKAEARARALLEKESKKLSKEANKVKSTKTETFKEIIVDVSASSRGSPDFCDIIPVLQSHLESVDSSLDYFESLLDQPPPPRPGAVPSTTKYCPPTILKFRRHLKARYSEEDKAWIPIAGDPIIVPEKSAIVYLTASELVSHLSPVNTLLDLPYQVRKSLDLGAKASVMVIVQGLAILYGKKAREAKKAFDHEIRSKMGGPGASGPARQGWEQQMGKAEIEKELVRLQIAERCFVTQAETDDEVVTAIISIAGDVAQRPYKLIDRSHLGFSVHNNKGKSSQDAYCKMLEQVPRVTTAVSQAVQASFPTLRSLMESYDELEQADRPRDAKLKQAPMLLAELQVGHRADGVPNSRKVGQALSRKIHGILRGDDGEVLVTDAS